MRSHFRGSFAIALSFLSSLAMSGCSFKVNNDSSQGKPIAAYCGSSQSIASGLTLTGTATYQYRSDGDGVIPDGRNAYKPTISTSPATYTLTVNGATGSFTCDDSSGTATQHCTLLNVVYGLVSSLNTALGSGSSVAAYGMSAVGIYPKSGVEGSATYTVSASSNLVAQSPRPIRRAEVHVLDSNSNIVNCAETDANGQFTTQIPADGSTYTVSVYARANNAYNTTYIMNNPNDNNPYRISVPVTTRTSTSVSLVAPATGTMEGGAFNIMDQILNAQTFLRTSTANCDQSGSATFLAGCIPVTSIPIVYTYWTPGLTPNVYYGGSSPISFYLIGKSQLYIGGGADGDSVNGDGDQFDNSVIIHEYGHSVEDHFGAPDSPGGSHSGTYVIDPRLAWGEGWADFFQAAVTGIPMYRDTHGSVTCGTSSCPHGADFNVALESGTPYSQNDTPTSAGEGNFREFSVTRLLWSVSSKLSQFSEIWTVLNGQAGMRVVDDHTKTLHRFHFIHTNLASGTNKKDWSSTISTELQTINFTNYETPLDLSSSCTSSSISMTVRRDGYDYSTSSRTLFDTSNQLRHNDFYVYNHGGGPLPVSLTWSGTGSVDLDLFIYQPGYIFGNSNSILAYDMRDANGSNTGNATATTGSASVSPNLPAGRYIINVMAATGAMPYSVSQSTTYSLNVANHAACPLPQ